jgi:branched-chain amino acid transport system ATP-binding protein
VLKVEELSAGYGRLQIISDVSIEAKEGEVTVVVGPNGSGKSTLLRAISGLAVVFSGRISVDGKAITGLAPHQIARLGLAYLPQTENVFTNLSVYENFQMAGYTVKRAELDARVNDLYDLFPRLKDYTKSRASNLREGRDRCSPWGWLSFANPAS